MELNISELDDNMYDQIPENRPIKVVKSTNTRENVIFLRIYISFYSIFAVSFSVKKNGLLSNNYLSIQNENYEYLIEYSKNKNYWLNFLLYVACVVVLLGLYIGIKRAYKKKVEKVKFSNEKFFEIKQKMVLFYHLLRPRYHYHHLYLIHRIWS